MSAARLRTTLPPIRPVAAVTSTVGLDFCMGARWSKELWEPSLALNAVLFDPHSIRTELAWPPASKCVPQWCALPHLDKSGIIKLNELFELIKLP